MNQSRRTLAALALGAMLLPAPVLAQEATPVPVATPGVLGQEPTALDCEGADAPDAAAGLAIDPAQSVVRYRVREQLAGVGQIVAVGETQAVIGQILFDADGNPLPCSRFDADLRTLKSDNSRRDNYLYTRTLETEKYPLATFVLTGVEGLDGPLAGGAETTFTLLGDFSVHGVTRPISWEATATLEGETLTGKAMTRFLMPEFDIVPPKVGPVEAIDELVQLEIELVAARPAQ